MEKKNTEGGETKMILVKDVTIEMKMTENVIKTRIVTIETMMRKDAGERIEVLQAEMN